MRLLKNFLYKEGNKTFSCRKVTVTSEKEGKEVTEKKYSVCFSDGINVPKGYYLPNRGMAKQRLISLLQTHTFLTKSEILKL